MSFIKILYKNKGEKKKSNEATIKKRDAAACTYINETRTINGIINRKPI